MNSKQQRRAKRKVKSDLKKKRETGKNYRLTLMKRPKEDIEGRIETCRFILKHYPRVKIKDLYYCDSAPIDSYYSVSGFCIVLRVFNSPIDVASFILPNVEDFTKFSATLISKVAELLGDNIGDLMMQNADCVCWEGSVTHLECDLEPTIRDRKTMVGEIIEAFKAV